MTVADEHLYVVAYDIGEPRRWRRVFKLMNGYGEWLQLSVFQCRLTLRRRAELAAALTALINHNQDHVLILDLGEVERVDLRVLSLGKAYAPVVREPTLSRRQVRASASVLGEQPGALANADI
jgi:CRISPR-associated protein Cas2